MIKFRYKRKEASDGGKSGTAIQKQKIEGLKDRELLPPKDLLLTGSLAGVRHNTLPRSRPPSSNKRDVPDTILSQTTLTLFRVSFYDIFHYLSINTFLYLKTTESMFILKL